MLLQHQISMLYKACVALALLPSAGAWSIPSVGANALRTAPLPRSAQFAMTANAEVKMMDEDTTKLEVDAAVVVPTRAEPTSIMGRLNKARDTNTVLNIVEKEAATMTGVELARALHKLAGNNKRRRASREALMRDRRFDALIDAIVACPVDELTSHSVADILWSCATLQQLPPRLLMPSLTSVAAQLEAEAFDGPQLARVVWSLARLETKPTKLLVRIEEQAITRFDGMNPQNFANLLWGFAKLNYQPKTLMPHISDALLAPGKIETAKAVEVADLAYALRDLAKPGEIDALLTALALRATPETALRDLSSRQLCKLVDCYATLEATEMLPDGLLDAWIGVIKVAHADTPLMARDGASLERALGRLGIDSVWIKSSEMLAAWKEAAGGGSSRKRLAAFSDEELQKVFNAIDVDGSGDIDLSELQQAMSHLSSGDADVEKMLAFGDSDGNLEISFEEFKRIMKNAMMGKREMIV